MRLRHDVEKAVHWPQRRVARLERYAQRIEKRAGRLLRLSIALRKRKRVLLELVKNGLDGESAGG